MELIAHIEQLLVSAVRPASAGRATAPLSALEHALQCAQLAEQARAAPALVAAALLHDLGHLFDATRRSDPGCDAHEMSALPLLAAGFGPAVLEPVRLHVQAKRYLVASDLCYLAHLPPNAARRLHLQGGPMCTEQCRLFEALPYADDAVALRRWDDEAHRPGRRTPPLAHYRALLEELLMDRPPARPRRSATAAGAAAAASLGRCRPAKGG